MIAQHLDHTAVGYRSALALREHALEFPLEGLQAGNAPPHGLQLRTGDGVCRIAGRIGVVGKAEQRADGVQRKAKLARVADELEPIDLTAVIQALIALRAPRRGQQADLLVVSDRLDLAAGGPRHLSDRHDHRANLSLEPTVTGDIRFGLITFND